MTVFYRLFPALVAIGLGTHIATGQAVSHELEQGYGSTTIFFTGELGNINGMPTLMAISFEAFQSAATTTFKNMLVQHFNANGDEEFIPSDQNIVEDKDGNFHMRFEQLLGGKKVEGAAMFMHFDSRGNVYAANGEFTVSSLVGDNEALIECEPAMQVALKESGLTGVWDSECEEAAVHIRDGGAYRCYKRTIQHDLYMRTTLFASVVNGSLLEYHPVAYGARTLKTYDCKGGIVAPDQPPPSLCTVASESSNPISSADEAISAAHNYTIAAYDYYFNTFNRNSLDNNGMTLVSLVHSCLDGFCPYTNALWDGSKMIYGDGDGQFVTYLSRGCDIVAHELSHGITDFSSKLIYKGESGAISEAWSDIFGATIEHGHLGKSVSDTWYIGEDVVVEQGRYALRNMADPFEYKQADFYPEKLETTQDYGGVHTNSGIINLAYALLVTGGVHPRGKTNFSVDPIDADFATSLRLAAEIFYYANTACFTPSINIRSARACTLLLTTDSLKDHVSTAWAAVGVSGQEILNPGIAFSLGSMREGEIRNFRLTKFIEPGQALVCVLVTSSESSDYDLYVRFDLDPEPFWYSRNNACNSANKSSSESCTTYSPSKRSKAFIAVVAFKPSDGGQLSCRKINSCKPSGAPCSRKKDCCPNFNLICNGTCKPCTTRNGICSTSAECCKGLKCLKSGKRTSRCQ